MGMFANVRRSVAMAKNAVEEMQRAVRDSAAATGSSTLSTGSPPQPFSAPVAAAAAAPPPPPPTSPFGAGPRPMSTPIDFGAMTGGMPEHTVRSGRIRPGWFALFLLLLAGGIAGLILGIVDLVRQNAQIESEAVATGTVAALRGTPTEIEFVSIGAQRYTIYIDVDTDVSKTRDTIVSGTECTVASRSGRVTRLDGSRQSVSNTIGDLSSIGSFEAPEGIVTVSCVQTPFGRSTANRLNDEHPFIVSPGTVELGGSIILLIGSVFALVGSAIVGAMAFRRRRPRSMAVA